MTNIRIKQTLTWRDLIALSGIIFGVPFTAYSTYQLITSTNGVQGLFNFLSTLTFISIAIMGTDHFLAKEGIIKPLNKEDRSIGTIISNFP